MDNSTLDISPQTFPPSSSHCSLSLTLPFCFLAPQLFGSQKPSLFCSHSTLVLHSFIHFDLVLRQLRSLCFQNGCHNAHLQDCNSKSWLIFWEN
ncbi:hypothetical protein L3X38_001280 [Prunus dulcis]|uniref:Uncharacterized protein n=1 Tax=Prunus dulcis TaxID=3755 RepID=A0AAD4WRP6_PRUDU|nr:hypothetical protein L3X38_001280 [Prunus dulcis]